MASKGSSLALARAGEQMLPTLSLTAYPRPMRAPALAIASALLAFWASPSRAQEPAVEAGPTQSAAPLPQNPVPPGSPPAAEPSPSPAGSAPAADTGQAPPPIDYRSEPSPAAGGTLPGQSQPIGGPSSYSEPEPSTDPSGYSEPAPVEPPPPPPKNPAKIPDFSVRVDPLTWLLEGRLGFELEVEAWHFISVELVPVFVVNDHPPSLNLYGVPDTLYQHSNGLGSLAGTSLGVGFWLEGKPFRGYVLRAVYTNYGYRYESKDAVGKIDSVKHTDRHIAGLFGSYSRWGPFTIGGLFGLGVEMNKQQRCFVNGGAVTSGCPDDSLLILTDRNGNTADLNGSLHPVYLEFRLSLGFVF